MRKVPLKQPGDEWWDRWLADCNAATEALLRSVATGAPIIINEELYKRNKYYFLMAHNGPFCGKCAYCERDLSSQNGDIEHYRPKKGTTDEDDRPITRMINDQMEEHPGYYWLAYDWANLLPSCQMCNVGNRQKAPDGKPGKRNRFPVAGMHAWTAGEEENEHPLLLNPTRDDPAEHLVFDRTGTISWKSERGRVTISILGLNSYEMPSKRLSRYKAVKAQVAQFLLTSRPGVVDDDARDELVRVRRGEGEYTSFAALAIEDALEEAEDRLRTARQQLRS